MPLHPRESNRQAIPLLVDGLYHDLKVIGCYRTAVQVYSRRGGSIEPWIDGPGAAGCFPLSGLAIGGFYPWRTRLGLLPADILPSTTARCGGGSSIIRHGMVHFSDPTGNAHNGFALDTNMWLTCVWANPH